MNKRQKKKRDKIRLSGSTVTVKESLAAFDFSEYDSRAEFHEACHRQSVFTQYEGNNLDAVFDMLTEISNEVTIRLKGLDSWDKAPDSYRTNIRKMFTRAEKENNKLTVIFE
ncbi:MAG: barstar family protein [Lachnospiraceae bacterium]|nr:barstar family protein [Lachnospiraceae bacterium]